ncbi:carboxypeptidase M32 [Dongia soli]|uniref:Metal-dependent carboxypeptidase n=1 Tax=Dongia soli TaxID=600628 RepID=A0ABU5E6V5_9PROT|nr:carboxypeptidase M32 [Dongia soli]MDY0881601.1 carboxypeptidase M32 [Dongia soli]
MSDDFGAMSVTAYRRLAGRFRRWSALREAAFLLQWDSEVMMPAGGASARSEQNAALELAGHGLLAAPEIDDLLTAAEADRTGLDNWENANLAEMRRLQIHATALDADLVAALSKASSACTDAWHRVKVSGSFTDLRPVFAEVVHLNRLAAQAKAEEFGCLPFEALMDQWEPGARIAEIDHLFDDYAAFAPDFIAEVKEHQAHQAPAITTAGPFDRDRQKALGERIMAGLGFDFRHGRLDTSLHPFSTETPSDVRITTGYQDDDFLLTSLPGILHETGHALYEQNLPHAWRLQPVGRSRGMSLHESQSLLIENQLYRHPAFCRYLSPLANQTFPGHEAAFEPANIHRLLTRINPSARRFEADEVTYPLHVILRYRLERALIDGQLTVADLPGAWNDGIRDLLGVEVRHDGEGCLQDIHWYTVYWGYFPCYAVGAMIAAQLFDAASRALPDLEQAIAVGDFTGLRSWLTQHIHSEGASRPMAEMLRDASDQALNPAFFRRHLRRQYLST